MSSVCHARPLINHQLVVDTQSEEAGVWSEVDLPDKEFGHVGLRCICRALLKERSGKSLNHNLSHHTRTQDGQVVERNESTLRQDMTVGANVKRVR